MSDRDEVQKLLDAYDDAHERWSDGDERPLVDIYAADQAKLGALLDMGLYHAGLEVVEPVREGSAIVGYRPINGARIVATLLVRGCVMRLREPEAAAATVSGERPGRASASTMLRLVRREDEA